MPASNEKELRDMIAPQMQEAVESLIDEIIKENEEIIKDVVYKDSSEYYMRTNEFKDAWSKNIGNYGNLAGADFDYDANKIQTFGRPEGYLPQHQSFNGDNIADRLADWIYEGHAGDSGINVPSRNAFELLEKWLTKSQFRLLFQDGMTRAGIKWKKYTGGIVKQKI